MKNDNYILIVEDSHTQARQLESILRHLGYRISLAYNGKDALSLLKRQKAIVVISDILMPEMDGYQLCHMIKTDDYLKDIPVILLTQLSDPKEIVRGLSCGANDFIVKPYKEELLIARIRSFLALKLEEDAIGKQITILVVEDSPTQAEQLKYLLEEHGYTVILAANGKEGIETARKTMPTIIISDILMPEMDGYELAYEIKRDEKLKKIPIILITSLMDRKEILRKASVVADGYFTKPYEDAYLLDKIKTLLSISNLDDRGKKPEELEVAFAGERYVITSGRRQILCFLLSTYESAVQQNHDLILMQRELQLLNERLEEKVTERTRQLQASEAKYRTLLENNADALVVVGKEQTVYFINKAAEILFGVKSKEFVGKKFEYSLSDGEIRDVEINRRGSENQAGTPREDAEKIIAEMCVVNTTWGEEKAYLATLRNITERKRKDADLARANKLESLGILAGGIAHDFNNLLTGVTGNVSLAKTLVRPDDPIYKMLADIEKASSEAKKLTQQLLTFAKGGSPVKKTASIAELIRDSANFAVRGSNTRCDFSITRDLCPLEVDEGLMSRVIHNLIINAKQAMPKGGIIKVSAHNVPVNAKDKLAIKEGNYVKITIEDTGEGIPQKYLTKIFDPYFTTKENGTGLGLATVYSVIKNHDGYVSVESKVGVGTTFSIYLPASGGKIVHAKNVEETLFSGKGKILIMDDEEIIRDVTGKMLTKLGYDVDFARNGSEAIELFREARDAGQSFHAIIMDLTIPGGMGGKDAVKQLLDIDANAKVIVSSGYSDDAIMSDYKKYGFSAVITKPYKITELSKAVHEVITGKSV